MTECEDKLKTQKEDLTIVLVLTFLFMVFAILCVSPIMNSPIGAIINVIMSIWFSVEYSFGKYKYGNASKTSCKPLSGR